MSFFIAMFAALTLSTKDAAFNQTSIQNELNRAKNTKTVIVVELPPGTYPISGALFIYSNTHLKANGTTLVRVESSDQDMLIARHLTGDGKLCLRDENCRHGGYSQFHNITVEGGIWDVNSDGNSPTQVMRLTHGEDINIENVTFKGATDHMLNLSASRRVNIKNCSFLSSVAYVGKDKTFWGEYAVGDSSRYEAIEAIHLDMADKEGENATWPSDMTEVRQIKIINCSFTDVYSGVGNHHAYGTRRSQEIEIIGCKFNVAHYAIMAYGFTNMSIMNNESKGGRGLVRSKTAEISVLGNRVVGSSDDTIFLQEGAVADICYNVFSSAGRHAVGLTDATARIVGNRIEKAKDSGIRIENGSDECKIEGNEIVSSATYGINLAAKTRGSIANNRIKDCGASGIRIADYSIGILNGDVIDSPNEYGLCVQSKGSVVAQNLSVSEAQGYASFYVDDAKQLELVGCSTLKSQGDGLRVKRSDKVKISGSLINGSLGNGIFISDSGDVALCANTIGSISEHGIKWNGSSGIIEGNHIVDAGKSGIYLNNSIGLIEANHIRRIGWKGVMLEQSTDCKLYHNDIAAVVLEGVHVSGSVNCAVKENRVLVDGERNAIRLEGESAIVKADAVIERNYAESVNSWDIYVNGNINASKIIGNECHGKQGYWCIPDCRDMVTYIEGGATIPVACQEDSALWKAWRATKKFNVCVGETVVGVAAGAKLPNLDFVPEPTMANARFVRWMLTTFPVMSGEDQGVWGDITLYPIFVSSNAPYRVRFDSCGAKGSMDDMLCIQSKIYILPKNVFRKDGYRFNGWKNLKTDRFYDDGMLIFNLADEYGEEIVLQAKWALDK